MSENNMSQLCQENNPIPQNSDNHERAADEELSPIAKVRQRNPNLQPLSEKEISHLRNNGRHSIQALPTVRSTSPVSSSNSLSRHHSFTSTKDFRSKFNRSSILKTGDRQSLSSTSPSTQTFWKYHVLEFGNGLYLTTNPDAKHVYCRNAPGYHVEVLFPKNSRGATDSSGRSGFRLLFRNEVDGDVFLTVTKHTDGFEIDLLRRYYEDKNGLLEVIESDAKSHHYVASETSINELKGQFYDSTTRLFRYQVVDFKDKLWYLGSIPQFKNATKLKNKRFVFFHEVKKEKILACFRPHEIRAKKKLIKKINRSVQSNSNSFYYNDENSESSGLSSKYDTIYYAPGDGLFQENPPDDSPNNEKLGWITIYDDYETLKSPGMWELILGFTLAAGFSKILEES